MRTAEAAPERRKPQSPRFTVRLSAGEIAMLREAARGAGLSASEAVRVAMYDTGLLELRESVDRMRPRAKRLAAPNAAR